MHRFRWIALAAAAGLAGAFALQPVEQAGAEQLSRVTVIDGDTIASAGTTYRLVNIDTPEMGRNARCRAEHAHGRSATQRARALIAAAARVETHPVGRTDSYGRTIAFVRVDGRDLGEILIAEGLARPWRGRREPWCDSSGALIL